MATTTAIDFLSAALPGDWPPMCVVFGDEPFFRGRVLSVIRAGVLEAGDAEFALSVFDGRTVEAREVFDALATRSLFGAGRRLVIVEDADDFVSRHRQALEDYLARPFATGVLAMAVKSWPSNTRLAKAVASVGLPIDCKPPRPAALTKWLVAWAKTAHGAKLARGAADLLMEIVGPEPGLLDQELAKLSAAAGGAIGEANVRELVGGWRAKTTWEMIDAALAGDADAALRELDRLLAAGENPIAILGQFGWSLRNFAAAAKLFGDAARAGRRSSPRAALEQAGVKSFLLGKAEAQLRQVGRQRGEKLYQWLLEADLAMKGTSSSPARARIVLEQLIARLARQTAPKAGAG